MVAQGFQLRRRRSQESCIPVGVFPFVSTGFVLVDLEGADAGNVTESDLLSLSISLQLAYNELVDCAGIPGSTREVQSIDTLPNATSADGLSSYLLRIDVVCNSCGEGEVLLFSEVDPSLSGTSAAAGTIDGTECKCEGPFLPDFIELSNVILSVGADLNALIAMANQIPVLDCPPQNFTSFNGSGVCLGPDQGIRLSSVESPSSFPSEFPSEFPSGKVLSALSLLHSWVRQ
jgi:hypothetical protein